MSFVCFLVAIIRKVSPGRQVSQGFQDLDRSGPGLRFAFTKSIKILGLKYTPMEDTIKFTLDDFSKRGF
jgi:hypothetical protein